MEFGTYFLSNQYPGQNLKPNRSQVKTTIELFAEPSRNRVVIAAEAEPSWNRVITAQCVQIGIENWQELRGIPISARVGPTFSIAI
jgi:hypothetical protein